MAPALAVEWGTRWPAEISEVAVQAPTSRVGVQRPTRENVTSGPVRRYEPHVLAAPTHLASGSWGSLETGGGVRKYEQGAESFRFHRVLGLSAKKRDVCDPDRDGDITRARERGDRFRPHNSDRSRIPHQPWFSVELQGT